MFKKLLNVVVTFGDTFSTNLTLALSISSIQHSGWRKCEN